MSQSGYNISDLVGEAQTRWLKPAEVFFILQNHEDRMITNEPSQRPASGSLFLFNKRVLRFFRRDGHSWRKKKDGKAVGEAHERLKVGNFEALNCYYAHGEQNPNFQRRSYWMLDPAYEHIVLVHYRDVNEVPGRNNAGSVSQFSPLSSSTFNQSLNSYVSQQAGSSAAVAESVEQFQDSSSPGSVEISSDPVADTNRMNYLGKIETTGEHSCSSGLEISGVLRRLEEQLSLNDDSFQEIDPFYYSDNGVADDFQNTLSSQGLSAPVLGCRTEHRHQLPGHEIDDWKDMLDGFNRLSDMPQVRHAQKFNENDILLTSLHQDQNAEQDNYTSWLNFAGSESQETSVQASKEAESFKYQHLHPTLSMYDNSEHFTPLFDQSDVGISLEDDFSLTISHKQKFTIKEISPEWGYASEATKVLIVGSFLCNPSEGAWTCMFGDVEVPVQIIQEGVISCHAPPHFPGKVTICITSGNRESCSEIREFEYRDKTSGCRHCCHPETEARSSEEMLLLVRFVQLLLATSWKKGEGSDSDIDSLGKSRAYEEDSWDQVIEALLDGNSTSSTTTDWLVQELLKDKLHNWLSSRSHEESDQQDCALSKKEQGVIHVVSGLGFEWALHPILKSGVGVNFRDINGWTALHWAARFGREKMVAELIASGASAGAVTDPNPQDLIGKTAASIAASWGHTGLAGYLSEVSLTSHLSSLTLEESELSIGSADVEAEMTLNNIPETNPITSEDQLSLKDILAAVRSAAQAAARIQSAFRAHSFRRRHLREAVVNLDEYTCSEIQGISSASKLAFRNSRDYNSAALSIQKKYRGWKGRKDFLALRQKVVKIQAHVRGYQVRKDYRVVWAVGILEKVVLRWRRRGVGLRGFRPETESIDELDDEEILRVFRKKKVHMAIDEAVSRVLSVVDSPVARQQYRRILEKYRQAKAELDEAESRSAASSSEISSMENDDINQVA